jgi:hypothetical protein
VLADGRAQLGATRCSVKAAAISRTPLLLLLLLPAFAVLIYIHSITPAVCPVSSSSSSIGGGGWGGGGWRALQQLLYVCVHCIVVGCCAACAAHLAKDVGLPGLKLLLLCTCLLLLLWMGFGGG